MYGNWKKSSVKIFDQFVKFVKLIIKTLVKQEKNTESQE